MRETSILSYQENRWTLRGHIHTLPSSPFHPSSAVRTEVCFLQVTEIRGSRPVTRRNRKHRSHYVICGCHDKTLSNATFEEHRARRQHQTEVLMRDRTTHKSFLSAKDAQRGTPTQGLATHCHFM